MSDPINALDRPEAVTREDRWTTWFMWFLRAMAAVSMLKGLYHWAMVVGIASSTNFEGGATAWQAATIYFAVIDLVAAVGLWLAAAWGGVVWLTAAISMAGVELLFPQIFGGRLWLVPIELALVTAYIGFTLMAARERPE